MFGLWIFRDEKLQGDVESGMEVADHGDGQFPFAVEDFGNSGLRAEVGDHVFGAEVVLFHPEKDDINRIM